MPRSPTEIAEVVMLINLTLPLGRGLAWERAYFLFKMIPLKGVVFVLILAVVIYFGGLVLMPPAILALPFSLSLYRKINDQSIANFLKFVPVRVQSVFA